MTNPALAKPRYDLLDGLRGVAALLVIIYHFGEGFATSPVDQMLNHGYLAVDFFFVLSGFVLGYAYDDRWTPGSLTSGRFMLRRLIRLQPMVVLSVILGAIAFIIQGSVKWDGTPVPIHAVIVALVLGLFMIPTGPGLLAEVRGNGEMFPLNGPAWSLFFEYIASILYAIWLHKLSRRSLTAVVLISAIGLAANNFINLSGFYHQGVGWTIADGGFLGGFFRVAFSFSAGLLICRTFRRTNIRGAFWICSAIIALVLACPYVSRTGEPDILNALYDTLATLIVFPLVVWIGACGQNPGRIAAGTCEFLGQISYPVYIVHYPVMYMFYAWVWAHSYTLQQVWPVCILLFLLIILMAWTALRFYDTPVRAWLSRRLLRR